jgi:hypothetical protein
MSKLEPRFIGRVLALAIAAIAFGPLTHAAEPEKGRAERPAVVKAGVAAEKMSACEAQKVRLALADTNAATSTVAGSPVAASSVSPAGPIRQGVCSKNCDVNCWRTQDCRGLGVCMRDCP